MIGLGWDDLGQGTDDYVDERNFYKKLQDIFREKYTITYNWVSDRDEFYTRATTERTDFLTVDLMAGSDTVGKDLAIDLRAHMAQHRLDPHFPILLLSSTPEAFTVQEAIRHNISLIPKQLKYPAVTAQQIAFRLNESGRFGRPKEVLILARHARESLGLRLLDIAVLEELRQIVEYAGCTAREVKPEELRQQDRNIVLELEERIREAGKIIVLLTKDERLDTKDGSNVHLGRPNIYFELGMLMGVRGGSRKLIVLREKGAYVPSDASWAMPIEFSNGLSKCRERILKALESPVQA